MSKFFIDKEDVSENIIYIKSTDVKHIVKVLRKNIGDILELSDGEGNKYTVKISNISNDIVETEIIEHEFEQDTNVSFTLYQSIPKLNKMDVIVQKCTELGVRNINPFINSRTVVDIKNDKIEKKKLLRWQKIASEACKQSQRAVIPKIMPIISFNELLEEVKKYDFILLAYENEKNSLKKVINENINAKNIGIIIGPEGGFDSEEVEKLINRGVRSISLGKRILRTETAGMTLLSILGYEFGEI